MYNKNKPNAGKYTSPIKPMGYVQGGIFQTLINLASSRAAFLGNRPQPWLGGCYNLPSLATKVFIADTGGWLWCLDLVGCPDLRIICWRCAVFSGDIR